jgi:hypothetical protein
MRRRTGQAPSTAVFAQIAAGAKAIVNKTEVAAGDSRMWSTSYQAIGQSDRQGYRFVSDAEFCFVGEIDDSDWSAKRTDGAAALERALADLSPILAAGRTQLREGSLALSLALVLWPASSRPVMPTHAISGNWG